MYLRFVVSELDDDSNRELGVFHAIANLRAAGKLYSYEEIHHDLVRQWFNENLEKPRFTSSKGPFYRKQKKAISWFEDGAEEHLSRVRELVAILRNHGVIVHMLKTDRVGYVVYEDEYQIVAEAFNEDRLWLPSELLCLSIGLISNPKPLPPRTSPAAVRSPATPPPSTASPPRALPAAYPVLSQANVSPPQSSRQSPDCPPIGVSSP